GFAIQNYMTEHKGTYPPLWIQDDIYAAPPNAYSAIAGKTRSWVTLIRRYLAVTNDNPYQGSNMPVFQCPNDTMERGSWLQGGVLSYTMPMTWGPDPIFYKNRFAGFGNPPNANTTVNRGIGQLWNGTPTSYPMWINTSMVKPAAKVLLLVERSY